MSLNLKAKEACVEEFIEKWERKKGKRERRKEKEERQKKYIKTREGEIDISVMKGPFLWFVWCCVFTLYSYSDICYFRLETIIMAFEFILP